MKRHFFESKIVLIHTQFKFPFPKGVKSHSLGKNMPNNSAQRKERVLLLMLLGMLGVLIVFFGGLLLKTHREFENFKERQNRIETKLIQARKEFQQKEIYLSRLLEDPEFLERVVRERLGYSRPDELLFRFSDDP